MRRYMFGLLFIAVIGLLGVTYTKDYRDYTLSYPLSDQTFDTSDTVYIYLPVCDTTIDTNYYGEIDTTIKIKEYPWPSVYDQNSQEGIESFDTSGVFVSHMTFDRWAMEDWAFCFFIEETSLLEDTDSVSADVQYQFVNAPAWTVLYALFSDADASVYLMTYYPLDLYDNWKLYKNARIRLMIKSDSVRVRSWLVGRQIRYHELVDPGE